MSKSITPTLSNRKMKKLLKASWRRRKILSPVVVTEGGAFPHLRVNVCTVRADGTPKIGNIAFFRRKKQEFIHSRILVLILAEINNILACGAGRAKGLVWYRHRACG